MTKDLQVERFQDGYELLEKYDCVCSECGHCFFIVPSLLMEHGINHGNCVCSKCKKGLRVKIDIENNVAISSIC